ncbi:hypothetical protein D3C71_2184470 [compost metagenome]
MPRLLSQGCVQAHEVRLCEHLFQTAARDAGASRAFFVKKGIEDQYAGFKAGQPLRHMAPDATHANQADRLAV